MKTETLSEVATRDTEVQRKDVPDSTRIRVWAKAAGRCVLCATYLLDEADSFWHAIPVGQIAHIVGAGSGKNAPRGESDLDANERSFEENLLLLCYRCHKRIDDKVYRDKYTVEFLTQRKQLHERRVREVTDFAILRPTSVVTVSADIRGTAAPVSLSQVAEALRPEGYTGMGDDTRNGAFTLHLPGNSNDGWAWDAHRTELDRLTARVAEAVTAGDIETISVFALAPIPSLVYLGSKLDDKTETRLFRRKRVDDVTAWAWDDETQTPKFDVALISSPTLANEATVIVELTSPVKESRLPSGLTSLPRVIISPTGQVPHPELITTRAALDEFGRAWREALARIENDLPDVRTLHLIASVPAPAAIAMGRYRMRTAQPTMVVYQLTDEGYEAAMEVTE
ncbi:SAVED domain-containing protein [Microbacterium sp. NPDC077057]|uniref:SAVED domain-containing protein n=1 Tax=Microbacterium sp. NPDC077057 TaxID=3154763 RepID=UPI00342C55A0